MCLPMSGVNGWASGRDEIAEKLYLWLRGWGGLNSTPPISSGWGSGAKAPKVLDPHTPPKLVSVLLQVIPVRMDELF